MAHIERGGGSNFTTSSQSSIITKPWCCEDKTCDQCTCMTLYNLMIGWKKVVCISKDLSVPEAKNWAGFYFNSMTYAWPDNSPNLEHLASKHLASKLVEDL